MYGGLPRHVHTAHRNTRPTYIVEHISAARAQTQLCSLLLTHTVVSMFLFSSPITTHSHGALTLQLKHKSQCIRNAGYTLHQIKLTTCEFLKMLYKNNLFFHSMTDVDGVDERRPKLLCPHGINTFQYTCLLYTSDAADE